MKRSGWVIAGLLLPVAISTSAMAAPRTLGVATTGGAADALASGLSSNLTGEEWAPLAVTAAVPGGERSLESAMSRSRERTAVAARARTAGETVHADAVLVVRVVKTRQARRVTLLVLEAAPSTAVRETQVLLPLAASAGDAGKLVAALTPLLAKLPPVALAEPPPRAAVDEPAAAPAARAKELEPDADQDPGKTLAPGPSRALAPTPLATTTDRDRGADLAPQGSREPLVRLAVVGGVASRSFSYRDRRSAALREYDLAAAPTVGARLDVYPLARTRTLPGLGAYGAFAKTLGLSSESAGATGGGSGATLWTRWDAGARLVVPIGRARLGPALGYGRESFSIKLAGAGALPSVDYAFLRPAVEGGFDIGPVAIDVSGAYLVVLDAGDAAARMRDTSVGGVEARAEARYPLGKHLEACAGGTYTRFFYAFSPRPNDDFVAGGALDQMVRGELAIAGRY